MTIKIDESFLALIDRPTNYLAILPEPVSYDAFDNPQYSPKEVLDQLGISLEEAMQRLEKIVKS